MDRSNKDIKSSSKKYIYNLPVSNTIERVYKKFSVTEKMIFLLLLSIAIASVMGLLWKINSNFLVTIPYHGGSIKEGVVGAPGPINPVLATSRSDKELTSLVYSGLLKPTSDGGYSNDLAKSFEVSPTQTEYTFEIREDAVFHDKEKVKASDVIFTIEYLKQPELRSPLRARWENVEVEVLSRTKVKITLPEPRPDSLELFTLGILPKHIWDKIEVNQAHINYNNVEPIGSGPFKIESFKQNKSRRAEHQYRYKLTAFKEYVHGQPYIDHIEFLFFQDEESAVNALLSGQIETLASPPYQKVNQIISEGHSFKSAVLPRTFAVFFNQNQNDSLNQSGVREALNIAIDREELIEDVFYSYALAISSPLPSTVEKSIFGIKKDETSFESEDRLGLARRILEDQDWEYSEETKTFSNSELEIETLTITLLVSQAPELRRAAQFVVEKWQELGVEVNLESLPTDQLNQNHIRPREFEAVLHGYALGRNFDLYPFWHSTQRSDPGVNISLYTNTLVDNSLEALKRDLDQETKTVEYETLKEEITNDLPAVFLYSPKFIYIHPEDLFGVNLDLVFRPEDRFLNVHRWYKETETVWKIFK